MANTHMKRCSASFTFKEMHIRTTVRYRISPTGVALIKMTSVGGDVEKLEPSYIVGRSINGAAAFKHSLSVPHLLEVAVSFLEQRLFISTVPEPRAVST